MPHSSTNSAPRPETGTRPRAASPATRVGRAATAGGLILLAGLAAACREEAPPRPTPPAAAPTAPSSAPSSDQAAGQAAGEVPLPVRELPTGQYTTSSDGGQSVVLGDLRIETSADLPQREGSSTQNVAGDNQLVFVLRGWQIIVSAGNLYVAGQEFGPAPSGSVIRLSKDGVRVGTELRGPLP